MKKLILLLLAVFIWQSCNNFNSKEHIELGIPIHDLVITLRGTTYQPVPSQCNSDPLHTANMTRVNLKELKNGSQKLCAFSYDLVKQYQLKFGDQFDVYTSKGKYLGRYTFCDRMNRRIKNTCDLMIHPQDKPDLYKNMVVKRVIVR